MEKHTYTDNIDCTCGCEGWWELCCDNKANRETFILSPCPSPNRNDDDWFIKNDNPLYDKDNPIKPVGNIPINRHHNISRTYMSYCVDKYFSK
jgi:hypothetical protein